MADEGEDFARLNVEGNGRSGTFAKRRFRCQLQVHVDTGDQVLALLRRGHFKTRVLKAERIDAPDFHACGAG